MISCCSSSWRSAPWAVSGCGWIDDEFRDSPAYLDLRRLWILARVGLGFGVPDMALKVRRKPVRLRNPRPDDKAFRLFWRIVDGAVRDAFNKHPRYLNPLASEATVRRSVNKRVVGALMGFALDNAKSRSE